MRKELTTQFVYLLAYFLSITLFKRFFDISVIIFWLGGFLGILLPYLDYLVFIYFLYPSADISVRSSLLIKQRDFKGLTAVLFTEDGRKTRKIFHTVHFYLIFLALSLLVLTSSASIFGRGIVLGFILHLYIEQVYDFIEKGNIDSWFEKIDIKLDREQQMWYLGFNALILLIFGFYF